jgi:hypothetical protein
MEDRVWCGSGRAEELESCEIGALMLMQSRDGRICSGKASRLCSGGAGHILCSKI